MNELQTTVRRFIKLSDVAAELNISNAQAYSLVRSGDLPAIQIGRRKHWRIEARVVEEYISNAYKKSPSSDEWQRKPEVGDE